MGDKVGRPKTWTDEKIEEVAIALGQFVDTEPIPLFCKFEAEYGNGLDISDHPEWQNNERFLVAYKKAKKTVEWKIAYGGLSGRLNTAMAIFTLKNVAGWRDIPPEKEDEELKGKKLVILGVPQNGDGVHRFEKFMTQ